MVALYFKVTKSIKYYAYHFNKQPILIWTQYDAWKEKIFFYTLPTFLSI